MKLLNCFISLFVIFCFLMSWSVLNADIKVQNGQGSMAGEVTDRSVILQSRLTRRIQQGNGDLRGSSGVARFEISTDQDFQDVRVTEWIKASAAYDYIIKTKVSQLTPGTRYFYRLRYGFDKKNTRLGSRCSFETLFGSQRSFPVSFVVVTGMNYAFFQAKYEGTDKHLGYPALATILRMSPNFFVGTGDNVYYDHPARSRARTQIKLRQKWHEQFSQQRFIDLFSQVPTYWEKDDHDHRFNDSDPHTPVRGVHATTEDLENRKLAEQPSNQLGINTFLEQLPVVDPRDRNPRTYRSHRISRELQIWLVEGRDYRSPNEMPDGPSKTLWGQDQISWLKRTLLASDATFKILISPTPMVGPDDAKKRDSHANVGGFQYEAQRFFVWLEKHGFVDRGFYLVAGDRHWQYHAIHPKGIEEFSCGAICDANAARAISPGEIDSTDPTGRITHRYTQKGQSGGFLKISIKPPTDGFPAQAEFAFYEEHGKLLYRELKTR